jgi:hypothetical protein
MSSRQYQYLHMQEIPDDTEIPDFIDAVWNGVLETQGHPSRQDIIRLLDISDYTVPNIELGNSSILKSDEDLQRMKSRPLKLFMYRQS